MARGGRRKAERSQHHVRVPLLLALVAGVALAVTAAALALGPDRSGTPSAAVPDASPSTAATSQAPLDLSKLPMGRTLACAALDDTALATALGAPPTSATSYVSGDRVEIAPGVTDTAHEDLCGFATPRAEAKVWVFAAPVSTPQARRLVRAARTIPRCTFPSDPTGFGTPGLTTVCTGKDTVATLRGLFGDAWLSCELSVSGPATADAVRLRADRWCVHVATTLGARP